jgi:crotonobetainyl-CoA:carnitine CoA-transferase CaiB-like acyl-CoA transferase
VDQIAQGMGGLMSVTGLPDTEPTRVGIPVADLSAGLYLAIGILVALHDRERTGVGQWVQTSLLEAMIAMMDLQAVRWTVEGVVPIQEGNHHPTMVPMGCFRSADGYVNIAGAFGRLLWNFCEVIGLPQLPKDPRFDTPAHRSANRAELNRIVGDRLAQGTTAEWVERLNAVGVPCGPVLRTDEVFADPHVEHLAMAAPVTSMTLGDITLLRNAVTMSEGPATVRTASPEAGQHTTDVLAELGLSDDEIAQLRRREVVA